MVSRNMSERHQRVKLISHPRRSCRQFMPEVAFDTVSITFSAFFIDPNGDRLHVGLVIVRPGQMHAYLIALAVHDNDEVAFVWGGFLDGRDMAEMFAWLRPTDLRRNRRSNEYRP